MSAKRPYEGTPFDLSGKTVLVAGACGLLGREFSGVLRLAGAHLVLADLVTPALKALKRDLQEIDSRGKILLCALDVTDARSVDLCVKKADRHLGGIDVLVNCAAVDAKVPGARRGSKPSRFTDFSRKAWESSIQVNLTGLFLLTQRVCKVMERRRRGSIVCLGSIYGMVGPDQRIYPNKYNKPAVYSVCKAGILGFARYLAAYYAGTDIRVNVLTPGGVLNRQKREFQRKYSERTILRRMAQTKDLEGAVLFLASDASSYMTGANLVVDGGWTAL